MSEKKKKKKLPATGATANRNVATLGAERKIIGVF